MGRVKSVREFEVVRERGAAGQTNMQHESRLVGANADEEEGEASLGLGQAVEDDNILCMAQPADARRRWLGLFCLTMAAGMLTWGLIVLGSHLQGYWFLVYWAVCFLFTIAALFIALLDMRAVRRRMRREQQDLLHSTLAEIGKPGEESPRPGANEE